MMNNTFARLISCLCFSLAVVVTLLLPNGVSAAPSIQDEQPETPTLDCRECHWDIYLTWEQSAHGQGLSCGQCHLAAQQDNHAREGHGAQTGPQACMSCHTTGYDPETDTWQEDDVHCTACHTPISPNHPEDPMPTNRSEELCGQCHIQAHFEWETSTHGKKGVTCVNCHSQHTTSLRSTNVSEQCATCHGARVAGFSHSEHNEQGLTCADCHLAPLDGPIGEGNAKRNHSFQVELSTCMSCHSTQLHSAVATETPNSQHDLQLNPPEDLDSMASNVTTEVSAEPRPVNPMGLAVIAGVLGLSVGLATTPWIGQLYRRIQGWSR